MRARAIVYAFTVISLSSACDVGPEEDQVDLDEIEASGGPIGTDGTPLSGTIAAGEWRTHTFSVTATSDIVAVLDWSRTTVNLNLFLYDPSGTQVAHANTTSTRPEEVSHEDGGAGQWTVAIKNKSSRSTGYTLSVSATPNSTGFVARYPAQPAPGTLFWGAAVTGNGDPYPRHEQQAGHPLSVRRTFFQWDKRTTGMITTARGDHENGRLPWVSTKTPPWAEMASGARDAEIDAMLRALDGLSGPVWLTIHHEPEGGGGVNSPDDPAGPAGHVAMNRRVRQRMTALGTDNIALAPILMTYTWTAASGRNPDEWWAPGIYDFLGVDHYQDSQATNLTTTWYSMRAWAAARSVDVAVGEWGMRGTDAAAGARVRAWYDHAANSHADGRGARVVGLSAYDSSLNSPTGSWELAGEQLRVFRELLGDSRTASILP